MLNLVLLYIVDYCMIDGLVDDIAHDIFAETATELVDVDMSLAEAGDIVGCTDFFEFGVYFGLVVVFLDIDCEFAGDVTDFFK